MKTVKLKKALPKYFFITPALLFFSFVILIPFIMGFNISLTNWDGLSKTYDYIGFKNFKVLFTDSDILIPLKNTLLFGLMGTVCNNFVALMLALLLSKKFPGRSIVRTIFFIPTCLSTVLASFIWSFIYRDVFHSLFGINSLLGNTSTVIPGIIGIILWNGVGINMLIYLSAISNVPKELYEAATIDGAGTLAKFKNVTIPMIMPAFTICITLTLTYSLREFAMTMAATNGGPARASETLAIYIYNNLYSFNKAGFGQAVSIVFMIILIIIGTVVSRIFRKKEVEL